jgi:hypothetical protein
MTEFAQVTNLIVENGEVVDREYSPIIQIKKLNGQGTLYKLTDANIESINAQREPNASINVDKFIRSVRSNFGVGNHKISALAHMSMPNGIQGLGMIRAEITSNVMVSKENYYFDEVESFDIFIYMSQDIVIPLDSWYEIIKKAYEDEEFGDDVMERCDSVMELAPNYVSDFFEGSMFDQQIGEYDKITVTRDRVYD